MRKSNLINAISIFDSSLSLAEWSWRLLTIFIIGSGGTLTAVLARADPVIQSLGPVYWVGSGIAASMAITFAFYLLKLSSLRSSEAELNRALSVPRSTTNPLSESFYDMIINIEDLRIPTKSLHVNKHFKRCKFIGPSSLMIMGGTYNNCHFNHCGDILSLPDNTTLTGVVGLQNCTVEECEFYLTTILCDKVTAGGFSTIPGISIKGI